MPTYVYQCKDCGESFEARHSMSDTHESCNFCFSENIFKLPNILAKNIKSKNSSGPPGKIVDRYIEQAKQDINSEKRRLKSEEL